jgi:hypothetical protein
MDAVIPMPGLETNAIQVPGFGFDGNTAVFCWQLAGQFSDEKGISINKKFDVKSHLCRRVVARSRTLLKG